MEISDSKKREYIKRLLLSRMRILDGHGFYGLLLMHMSFALDDQCETAATDGRRIVFSPVFLDELSDRELDFILMHETLHVVLQHNSRYNDRDRELFNIACDIVVNSNILLECGMNPLSITLKSYGESMHVAPDGREGYEYNAEEVYEQLMKRSKGKDKGKGKGKGAGSGEPDDDESDDPGDGSNGTWDDHSRWGNGDSNELRDEWIKHFMDAVETISIRESNGGRGTMPAFAKRIINEMRRAQNDWRTILNNFIQEDIVDYSFVPPDRRYGDSGFFLPDFNEKDEEIRDILFMVDTSGSMSDDEITLAFSEIRGAIEQFGGKLRGWLGFFDALVVPPVEFDGIEDISKIKPYGGGGTKFDIIFDYVRGYMQDKLPVSIIILTDGYASFPKEDEAMGIPVMWVINNEEVNPPWGKVIRLSI